MENNVKSYLVESLNKRYLDLILYPTEQCNFRCTYCYEDFEIGKMSPAIINSVKELIKKRAPDLDHLHLSWFGGEPLLGKSIISEISTFAFDLKKNQNIKISGSMTTNAYHLNLDTMKDLNEFEIRRFQISLDGLGDAHNQTRKLMSGKGTFDRIWKNLLNLRKSDLNFSILLRLHITPENKESMKDLAKEINGEFYGDARFEYLVKPIGDWGGPNSGKISTIKNEEKKNFENEMLEIIYGSPKKTSSNPPASAAHESVKNPLSNSSELSYKNNVVEELPYVCYASKPNSLAVRADGKIQKCTVMLKDERNTVGNIKDNGDLSLDSGKMKMWMRGYQDGDFRILGCPATKLPENTKSLSEIAVVQIY